MKFIRDNTNKKGFFKKISKNQRFRYGIQSNKIKSNTNNQDRIFHPITDYFLES